jgi:hypothetical protein
LSFIRAHAAEIKMIELLYYNGFTLRASRCMFFATFAFKKFYKRKGREVLRKEWQRGQINFIFRQFLRADGGITTIST